MKISAEKVVINGVNYVQEGTQSEPAELLNGLEYKIVRTYSAGVFAGYIQSRNGKEVVMLKARRLWAWYGAASLSQLAEEGTSKPTECKFPCEVEKIELTEAIEILSVTEKGKKSIASVPVWQQ